MFKRSRTPADCQGFEHLTLPSRYRIASHWATKHSHRSSTVRTPETFEEKHFETCLNGKPVSVCRPLKNKDSRRTRLCTIAEPLCFKKVQGVDLAEGSTIRPR
ncbi:hypothetical protein Bbelb_086000 [Branchiostoma belcheri]|nr:hypothetical protein Bbelb_086000 [Branchiostoma belcheri]